MRKRIGIVFGGRSGEHEVSVQSAESIRRALDKEKYDVVLIGVDQRGVWRLADSNRSLLESSNGSLPRVDASATALLPVSQSGQVVLRESDSTRTMQRIDVFFPIIHGTYGEDGSLQGLLRLLDAPFVGAGVLGSAVGMDKDVMKRLLREAGIRVARFVCIRDHERDEVSYDVLASQLATPFFVKPCNLGSSVGIHRVTGPEQFEQALADAFQFDRKILVEENVSGRELECSVLGNDNPAASVPGEIVVHADFYSYEAKYINETAAELRIPADVGPEKAREVQETAVAAFRALECRGMARVDFFLKKNGDLVVNELNTLPGFTRISMYPKLWEASGLSYPDLLDRLIELAIEDHEREAGLKRTYGN